MVLDPLTCINHGYLRHVATHEGGHAAAAVILGFEFVNVTIAPPAQTLRGMLGGKAVEAGGVLMPTERPIEWVGPRPDDALAYVLAGSLSEELLLGHFLPKGFVGDLDIWRRGTRRFEGMPQEEMPMLLAGKARAGRLVADNRAAIERVRDLLIARVQADSHVNPGEFSEPVVVTYAEARAAVVDGG